MILRPVFAYHGSQSHFLGTLASRDQVDWKVCSQNLMLCNGHKKTSEKALT